MKQISLRNYYLCGLWLPVIIPAAILGVDIFLYNTISVLGYFLLASMFVGGIQYLFFALWATYRYHKSSTEELEKFILKSPVRFIPVCALGVLIFFMIGDIINYSSNYALFNLGSLLISSLGVSLFSVPYGYFYIGITYATGFLLKKLNLIKTDAISQ